MPSSTGLQSSTPPQQALDCKDAVEREKEWEKERAGFAGRLSPPTLTPIQPVSLAMAGTKRWWSSRSPHIVA
ncbi:hypothetical protein FQA47_020452 [Oryzias melastigma]|uniref:Uncharacterized protein n=1 Tax=Oryzias melastigma TaxID=30732 RepID=A0A834C6D4_ORYME|nr:hypothetical protein FQA47_020452 [Oryzias melastigma]